MDRYVELLPPALRNRVFAITALEWIALDDALACYAACDALDLPGEQQREIGRVVSSANNGALLETLARLAGKLGATPWLTLRNMDKVWLRSNRGGGVAVYKVSDRSARIELWRVPLVVSPFFCVSLCGAVEGGLELFRRSASVVEAREEHRRDGLTLTASW